MNFYIEKKREYRNNNYYFVNYAIKLKTFSDKIKLNCGINLRKWKTRNYYYRCCVNYYPSEILF